MPDYLKDLPCEIGGDIPGVLQRFNAQATRTTVGCPNRCLYCAVPRVEGAFQELEDWPDGPIICDNNLLNASLEHFDKVCDKLDKWGWADFNQGIDCRLLTEHHAERIAKVGEVVCRLALDHQAVMPHWERAFDILRKAGIRKNKIASYVLIGYNSGPSEAWDRCEWVESHGIHACPMWFHPLDSLDRNNVTREQYEKGWTDYERRKIMQWFYKHKKAVG
jgi:hypothetical protein